MASQENRTPETNISIDKVPHSGDSTVHPSMQDRPAYPFPEGLADVVGDIDKDENAKVSPILDDDVHYGHFEDRVAQYPSINVDPESPVEEDNSKRNLNLTNSPEPSKKRGSRVVGIAAAGLALAGIVGAGVFGISNAAGSSKNSAPKKNDKATSQISNTPSATPSAEQPTPTSTPDRVPKLGVLPDSMKTDEQLSLADFNNIPKAEQLSYLVALFGGMENIKDFAADTYRVSQDKNDILPTEISQDNSPQEILTSALYAQRLPFALSGEDRQKASIAALDRNSASPQWQNLSTALAKDPQGMTGGAVAYQNLVPMPTIVSSGELSTVPNSNQKYRDLNIEYNGTQLTERFYLETFTYQGQTVNWWLQE